MKLLSIALLNLRRTFRKRSNVFFIVLIPFLMILMFGLMFGEQQQLRLAVHAPSGELAERVVTDLADHPSVEVVQMDSREDLVEGVERGQVDGGLDLPSDYDTELTQGNPVEAVLMGDSEDPRAIDLQSLVRGAIQREAAELRAAGAVAEETGGSFEEGLGEVEETETAGVEVTVAGAGGAPAPEGVASFYLAAPPLLLLYTFLTALTTAVGITEARARGITRRTYATPTRAGELVMGDLLGRLLIAFAQGALIMVGSALLFGVNWGDPLGAGLLLALFCAAGGGAALLLGSAVRNENTVNSLALLFGLGLAVLGGTVMPLDTMGETMRSLASWTPHAWGVQGFQELVHNGGGVADIATPLAVLTLYAGVLLSLGALAARRSLTR